MVHTHNSITDTFGFAGNRYQWSDTKGFSGYATGPSVAKVRMHIARSAVDSGYYRSIGAALVALTVRRGVGRVDGMLFASTGGSQEATP